MQVEILQFLIQARDHLRATGNDRLGDDSIDDLQAVERALPDCDWFELEEIREARRPAGLHWDGD